MVVYVYLNVMSNYQVAHINQQHTKLLKQTIALNDTQHCITALTIHVAFFFFGVRSGAEFLHVTRKCRQAMNQLDDAVHKLKFVLLKSVHSRIRLELEKGRKICQLQCTQLLFSCELRPLHLKLNFMWLLIFVVELAKTSASSSFVVLTQRKHVNCQLSAHILLIYTSLQLQRKQNYIPRSNHSAAEWTHASLLQCSRPQQQRNEAVFFHALHSHWTKMPTAHPDNRREGPISKLKEAESLSRGPPSHGARQHSVVRTAERRWAGQMAGWYHSPR